MASKNNVIVGLGETGLSFARFLASRGEECLVLDDSPSKSNIDALEAISPGTRVESISSTSLQQADEIFVSPGVPLGHAALAKAQTSGKQLRGDIQLFGELSEAPIVGITGTNGKSTVSRLVFELIRDQEKAVSLAGNIGTPCLDVLSDKVDYYVLEVSSYQLELATELPTEVSVVLNLAPDHLDRYEGVQDYYQTKIALYANANKAVINRSIAGSVNEAEPAATFGEDVVLGDNNFGLSVKGNETWLMQGNTILLSADELQVTGTHNYLNVLAGLAIGWLLELDMELMLDTARRFIGLPHRSQRIAEIDGVTYINDSKATNPGAMVATIKGQATGKNVHLIAGGDSKGLSFDGLAKELVDYLKGVYLVGADYQALQDEFSNLEVQPCDELRQAVVAARARASKGDIILLSPGCASQDQFRSYIERGNTFKAIVEEYVGEGNEA